MPYVHIGTSLAIVFEHSFQRGYLVDAFRRRRSNKSRNTELLIALSWHGGVPE
jgi:hypothetical protein